MFTTVSKEVQISVKRDDQSSCEKKSKKSSSINVHHVDKDHILFVLEINSKKNELKSSQTVPNASMYEMRLHSLTVENAFGRYGCGFDIFTFNVMVSSRNVGFVWSEWKESRGKAIRRTSICT